jgi:AcrR family transcriptional regulator
MLPSVTDSPKPRWARRKTARPQELLAAALDLFVERGFAATRLDDVAARAGVSKGTLYLYFENKEELFKAVVRENMLPLLGEAEAAIDAFPGHSADLFREIIMGWWERIGNTRLSGITKLMMAESGNFPEVARFYHEEVIRRADGMIRRLLERGMARGEFRRIDTAHATSVVIAPVLMLMMWKHSFADCQPQTIAPQPYLECVIDLLLNGMATSAPTSVALATSGKAVATDTKSASAAPAASALPVAPAPSEPPSVVVTHYRSPPHA